MSELEERKDDKKRVLHTMMLRCPPDRQARFQQDSELEELIVDVGLQFHPMGSGYWMGRVCRVLPAVPLEALAKAKRILPWITDTLIFVISTRYPSVTDYCLDYVIQEALNSGSLEKWIPLVPKSEDQVYPTFFPDVDEAKAIRARHAKTIFDNYDNLRRFLQAMETEINHRWTTAEPKRREEILKMAWLGINIRYLLDVRCFVSGKTPQMEACLWPHINLEDLSGD
jgi:hypothetical protein